VPESLGEEFELVGVEVEVEVASQYEDTYVVWYEDTNIVEGQEVREDQSSTMQRRSRG
jgi:hypothetical protein